MGAASQSKCDDSSSVETIHAGGFSPATVESIAGLSAGAIATLVVHPLDIVKTRMQIHRSTTASTSGLTTFAILRTLAQDPRPMAALYRGLTPNLAGNAAGWSSFFFIKSRIERAMTHWKGTQPGKGLTPGNYFIASGLAGCMTQVMTNPIWVLKTRMLSSDRHSDGAYQSMWTGARRLLREEGLRGLYRGLGVSLLGVSHGAIQFAVYDPLKRMYFFRQRQAGAQEDRITNEVTVVISSAAKLVAGIVAYPQQVLRSRLQNYDADERFGQGIRGVARRIWKEEGFRGFYRGLTTGVVRVLPSTWVTFLVYENVKYHLPRWTSGG